MLTTLFSVLFLIDFGGPSVDETLKLATASAHRGDYATATSVLTQAVDHLPATAPRGTAAMLYSTRGMAKAGAGDYRGAESDMRHAYQIALEIAGRESDPGLAIYLTNLAFPVMLQNKLDQAELLLLRAQSLLSKTAVENQELQVQILSELASVYASEGKFRPAEDSGEAALRMVERKYGAESEEAAMSRVNLGNVYLRANQPDLAEKVLPHAVETERHLLQNERILTEGVYRLAELRAKQKRWTEAGALYEEALSHYGTLFGTAHPDYAAVAKEYAQIRKHLKPNRTANGFQPGRF